MQTQQGSALDLSNRLYSSLPMKMVSPLSVNVTQMPVYYWLRQSAIPYSATGNSTVGLPSYIRLDEERTTLLFFESSIPSFRHSLGNALNHYWVSRAFAFWNNLSWELHAETLDDALFAAKLPKYSNLTMHNYRKDVSILYDNNGTFVNLTHFGDWLYEILTHLFTPHRRWCHLDAIMVSILNPVFIQIVQQETAKAFEECFGLNSEEENRSKDFQIVQQRLSGTGMSCVDVLIAFICFVHFIQRVILFCAIQ